MKKYWVYLKVEWQGMLQHRGDLIIWTVSNNVFTLVGFAVWFVISSNNKLFYSAPQIILYFLLTIFVYTLTQAWHSYFIAEQIRDGKFTPFLIKPFSVAEANGSNNIAEKSLKLIFSLLPLLIIGFIFLRNTNLGVEINLINITLFTISILFAGAIAFFFDIAIGLTYFWTHDTDFVRNIYFTLNYLFSGRIVPLIFLPATLSTLAFYLPFRYTLSFPIEILMNRLTPEQIILGFVFQIFWFVVSFVIYRKVYSLGIKVYQGYGG